MLGGSIFRVEENSSVCFPVSDSLPTSFRRLRFATQFQDFFGIYDKMFNGSIASE